MNLLARICFYLRTLFVKRKLDAQLSEEVRTHVEMATEANLAKGMAPDEARNAALREFGNVASLQERARDERGWVWLEQAGQDGRYALRQLVRSPGFTTVVVLTLALGIGATTAIYSVVDTVILNPVGGAEPERMVHITQREVLQGREWFNAVSSPVLEALLAQGTQFAGLAYSNSIGFERKVDDFVKMEHAALVSPNFFSLLDTRPLLGRDFLADDAVPVVDGRPTGDAPIILSHAWWQSAWGGDRQMLGRTIEMNGRHFTVAGIMPPHVRFPKSTIQFWIPVKSMTMTRPMAMPATTQLVLRLKPETTLQQAQILMDTLARRLMSDHPGNSPYGNLWRINPKGLQILVQPLDAAFQVSGNWTRLRQTLFGLSAAIGFVLLIVCANVASLALARVESRQHELAIRAATGASQGRLMRQLLTENLILALLGGGLGLGLAAGGVKLLMTLNEMPQLRAVQTDASLFGVALTVSALSGLAFGLVPMWQGSRVRVNALLIDGGMNSTAGRHRSRYRNGLVVAQLAVTVVLLAGAGLMLRSANRQLQADPSFDPQNLLLVDVVPPAQKYEWAKDGAEQKSLLLTQLHERLGAVPGVKAVGFQQNDPLLKYQVDGRSIPLSAFHAQVSVGTGDAFRVLGVPLRAGRYFAAEESTQTRYVMVNEMLARQFWPEESAVGKTFRNAYAPDDALEVIGVVGDARTDGYSEEIKPTVYHPFHAMWTRSYSRGGGAPIQAIIRTQGDPELVIPFVRNELKSSEPGFLLPRFRVAKQVLFDSTLAQRTYRNYLGLFAGLGLLLSSLGIYGVLTYSVTRRTREIGIRLAIGAEGRQVRAMIMRQGLWLIGSGLTVGLGVSLGLTRFLQGQLYEVNSLDPLVMSLVVVLLSVVALFACWLPARRAAKVDPVIALRAE